MKKFNFHVKPIGLLDMLHFKQMVPDRRAKLAAGSLTPLTADYAVNRLARSLHPKVQEATVAEILPHKDACTYVLRAEKLAFFRAGQYVSVKTAIGPAFTARPYTLSSSPARALEGEYAITVKKTPDGFVSDYILNNWHVGDRVTFSGPEGTFSYEPLRDERNVVALAGGSGVTPFVSMARAIRDGLEDFSLTLLYGSRTREDILFMEELTDIAAATDKVRVIHVLSDEQAEGFEHGFLTPQLIRKYAVAPCSLFICGPRAMYAFLDSQLAELGLDHKHVRREVAPPPSSPVGLAGYAGDAAAVYRLTVTLYGETREIPLRADETILTALERAGVHAPSRCRSGECGWCRARLISGEAFVPDTLDGRRLADVDAGYLHPCCAWALSDISMEVFPE